MSINRVKRFFQNSSYFLFQSKNYFRLSYNCSNSNQINALKFYVSFVFAEKFSARARALELKLRQEKIREIKAVAVLQ